MKDQHKENPKEFIIDRVISIYSPSSGWIDKETNKYLLSHTIAEEGDCLLKFPNGYIRRYMECSLKEIEKATHFKPFI